MLTRDLDFGKRRAMGYGLLAIGYWLLAIGYWLHQWAELSLSKEPRKGEEQPIAHSLTP
jgi:hypothetical protein